MLGKHFTTELYPNLNFHFHSNTCPELHSPDIFQQAPFCLNTSSIPFTQSLVIRERAAKWERVVMLEENTGNSIQHLLSASLDIVLANKVPNHVNDQAKFP
jgi:hypothetical protein